MSEIKLNTIEEAIEDFREGKFLIVVDDEDRENEGDFIIAAEKITPEKVNFMLKNGRGVLCAPITEERCQELELDMQVANNTSLLGTPFTITVDKLGGGCTTGVSMFDRAETILALADPKTTPCRSEHQTVRLGPSGTYQSASRPFAWCVAPCRTYRSRC
ncbi:3 4-dihydroxy-2-butanone-4-phosphate synthase [Parabacteroides johnsonii CAG:246]|nr:3 4-dihydroxy-2-butanone-4-phosphate synthase [Parabacteroides johnsonii CAG:246]